MNQEKAAVTVLKSPLETEKVIKKLQFSGFDMKKLSIVSKDYLTEEQAYSYYIEDNCKTFWGNQETFWEPLWGVFFGSAFFLLPGLGPLVIAGPLVSPILGALEETTKTKELSPLGVGLNRFGISNDRIKKYETAIKREHILMIVHGRAQDIRKGVDTLHTLGHDVVLQPTQRKKKYVFFAKQTI